MRQMSATHSVVPNADSTVYIVLDDFEKLAHPIGKPIPPTPVARP